MLGCTVEGALVVARCTVPLMGTDSQTTAVDAVSIDQVAITRAGTGAGRVLQGDDEKAASEKQPENPRVTP